MDANQIYKLAKALESGKHGSFFSAIGVALQLADSDNQRRLIEAFEDKFQRFNAIIIEAEKSANQ